MPPPKAPSVPLAKVLALSPGSTPTFVESCPIQSLKSLPCLPTSVPCACRHQVIASLRRELENLEAETEGAKAKAAEEAARRHQIQAEVETLRCSFLGRKVSV